jgi:hypothetical protein
MAVCALLVALMTGSFSCRSVDSPPIAVAKSEHKEMAPKMTIEEEGQKGVSPVQRIAWDGQEEGFSEWGQAVNGIFATSAKPNVLVTWHWNGQTLKKDPTVPLPRVLRIVVLGGGRYLSLRRPGNEYDPWPLTLASVGQEGVIKEWACPKGDGYSHTGGSRNGKFVAVTADITPARLADDDYKPLTRIGRVDLEKQEMTWVGELAGYGVNMVRQIAVSDDGEYIAIGGWDNGIALANTSQQKVLWSLRPKTESGSRYVGFASDGLTLYVGGSEGCVYAMDTKTGRVLRQFYATSTGQSIYGHRISCLAVSPDDAWVAVGTGPEGEIYVFDTTGKSPPKMLPHGMTTVLIVSFSPDSSRLASVAGSIVKVWSIGSTPAGPKTGK